eukprot:g9186.t1
MDRRLQSSLEKKTRVGWQARVYRLERGYLSGWADVSSAAAHEEPSLVMCLFQGDQVATLFDQGDKRFKLDFPWDGAKTLQLRANNSAMKDAWVSLLQATLKEAESQIKATGSVFAYGGTAKHEQDEAYEEAAYLKTNRFLAAYVVDEQSRASYVNDLLNEGFQQVGDRAGGGGDVRRTCAGARAAIAELLALIEDFKEEMEGVEELRRGLRGGENSSSHQLNPSVAAPKIQRFCEEHMSLVGRTISTRLMLELSPLMDSSVAGTSAAPTDSTRAEVVSTRKRLDEAYEATDRIVILGTRAWFMDIRDCFLDCAGLEQASAAPPSPPPAVATQTADLGSPPMGPAGVKSTAADEPASPLPEAPARRSSSKALLQVSSAFSAAKAATKGGASRMGSSLSIKGRGTGKTTADAGPAAESKADAEREGKAGGGGRVSSRPGVSMSIPGVFRRGSRGAHEKEHTPAAPPSPSPPTKASPRGSANTGSGGRAPRPPDTEERERSDLFGGSSRSHSNSPRTSPKGSPRRSPSRSLFAAAAGQAIASEPRTATSDTCQGAAAGVAAASSLPAAAPAPAARKEKRAFAGGVWSGAGGGGCSRATAPQSIGTRSKDKCVTVGEDAAPVTSAAAQAGDPSASVSVAAEAVPKPKAGGSKRRFAGGDFSRPTSTASRPSAQPPGENPFAAGGGGGAGDSGGGGARVMGGGRTRAAHGSALGGGQRMSSGGRGADEAVPAWAASAGAGEKVPEWAASAFASEPPSSEGKGNSGGTSNSFGLAPPSRADQGRQEAAENSPFMTVKHGTGTRKKGPGKGHSSRRKAKALSWRDVWTALANPADVEATGQPTVLWSGGNHFEVPVAPSAGTKVSAGNALDSVMDVCLLALNRSTDDPVDDVAFGDAVISFVCRIPRRTGTAKKVPKIRGAREFASCGSGGLGPMEVSEAPDASVAPAAPAVPMDAGLPPTDPEDRDAMDVSETTGASVDVGLGEGKVGEVLPAPALCGAIPSASASSAPSPTDSASSIPSSPGSPGAPDANMQQQAGEVAPAFGGAIPSASAPSVSSSADSAPSAPSSTDSRGGENGGGPDEDTPESRDAMGVYKIWTEG